MADNGEDSSTNVYGERERERERARWREMAVVDGLRMHVNAFKSQFRLMTQRPFAHSSTDSTREREKPANIEKSMEMEASQ
jgi:hypothetical protein